jgi:hypothetical protein
MMTRKQSVAASGGGQSLNAGQADRGAPRLDPTPVTTAPPKEAGGRPPREALTAQQLRGLDALITHSSITAAAAAIGVHPRTISRWMREPAFRSEYIEQLTQLREELWREMLSVKEQVWGRFLQLLRSTDDRIALRAATWFLGQVLTAPSIMNRSMLRDEEPVLSAELHAFLGAETRPRDADGHVEGAHERR